MAGAAHYLEAAAKMRRFAEDAGNAESRAQFLQLADEYIKLAKRAQTPSPQREAGA
jgi:hypothetical protein